MRASFAKTGLRDLQQLHGLLRSGRRALVLHSNAGTSHYFLLFCDEAINKGKISCFNPSPNGYCLFSVFVRLVQLARKDDWLKQMELPRENGVKLPKTVTVDQRNMKDVMKLAHSLIEQHELQHMKTITNELEQQEFSNAMMPKQGTQEYNTEILNMQEAYTNLACTEGDWMPDCLSSIKCTLREDG